ncbi:MAG TPA: hypothetical protein PLQ82_02790 [Desulfobacteraceae bacterium]|nr:hypothetical protein [Desulfobacteraceae bacterium]HPQ27376.1 hypothetical protein [Desulfobacteraceae bacterium]
MNYPAAEQRGILKNIERPKGRGLVCLRQDQTLVRLWRIENFRPKKHPICSSDIDAVDFRRITK